jgi:hypothetical protein
MMTDESPVEPNVISPEVLRGVAAAAEVILTGDRAAMLVPQAVQHFAQLRFLDAIANASTEPASELRLDQWTRPVSD